VARKAKEKTESTLTEAQIQARRENGKLGGRPRKKLGRTRMEMLDEIGNTLTATGKTIDEQSTIALAHAVVAGEWEAVKWWKDQRMGTAKSTVELKTLPPEDLVQAMGAALHDILGEEQKLDELDAQRIYITWVERAMQLINPEVLPSLPVHY